VRIALLQIHSISGQVAWNTRKVIKALENAKKENVDLVVTPELALIGYPPDDLLTLQPFLNEEKKALVELAAQTQKTGVALLVGHTELNEQNFFWNSASLFEKGECVGTIRKKRLPSYNIFSEARHFASYTKDQAPLNFRGKRIGISICEDAWDEIESYGPLYLRKYESAPPVFKDERKNCDLHINLSASPFEWNKGKLRKKTFQEISEKLGKPFFWINRVGSQDEVLFDGKSAIYDGKNYLEAKAYEEDFLIWDSSAKSQKNISSNHSSWENLSEMLQIGLKNFVHQSGAEGVIVGLSGGVDSACVATLAAKALGPENVLGISLPSDVTSEESKKLARDFAQNLKIQFKEVSISSIVAETAKALELALEGIPYENLQSRARGIILMAEANRSGKLLLACGNKSELAMGYGTLYGDIAGALAPIGDLLKTEVYGLCHFWNKEQTYIQESILKREPTAELAPQQRDTDSLPPYEILDAFLNELLNRQGKSFVEKDWKSFLNNTSAQELMNKVLRAQFKRYQAPPLLRVSNRAFGLSWRMPISTTLPKN
jgi:NAD+ synthase (glutamine-hydrolysing)